MYENARSTSIFSSKRHPHESRSVSHAFDKLLILRDTAIFDGGCGNLLGKEFLWSQYLRMRSRQLLVRLYHRCLRDHRNTVPGLPLLFYRLSSHATVVDGSEDMPHRCESFLVSLCYFSLNLSVKWYRISCVGALRDTTRSQEDTRD